MKKIFFIGCALLAMVSCEKLPSTQSNFRNVALLEAPSISTIKVKDETGSEGTTQLKVRISNPLEKDTYYKISFDNQTIKNYNEANNVGYEMLPATNIEMTYTQNGVTKTGTELEVLVPKGQVASVGNLEFSIKPMVDEKGEKLSGANNYAVAIKMEPLEKDMIVQAKNEKALYLITRSFKTTVAHLSGKAFHAIYGKDTGKQEGGKEYAGDVELEAWTMQYSIAPVNASTNAGLMYPNVRTHTNSPLYNVLYNGSFLFINGGLKLGFNTPEGKDFKFNEVRDGNPTSDKWYHIAVTYEKIDGRPILKMYVNGILVFYSPAPAEIKEFPILCLGNANLNAYVREIRLWSRALTQGQIAATQSFVKPDAEGLELYIPYNEEPYESVPNDDGTSSRVIKNKSTFANKKLPEKWYVHQPARNDIRLPNATYNTEVEF